MAHHLVRRHPPPATDAVGAQLPQPSKDLRVLSSRANVFIAASPGCSLPAAPAASRAEQPLAAGLAERGQCARPAGLRVREQRSNSGLPRSASNCGRLASVGADEVALGNRARRRYASPASCCPTSQSSHPSWNMASGSSWIFRRPERFEAVDHLVGAAVEPRQQVVDPRLERGNARRLAHRRAVAGAPRPAGRPARGRSPGSRRRRRR